MGGPSQSNDNRDRKSRSRSRSRSGGRHESNTGGYGSNSGGYGSKDTSMINNDYFKNQEYWRQKREAASKAQTQAKRPYEFRSAH